MTDGNGKDAPTIYGPDNTPAAKTAYELAGVPLIFGETLEGLVKWFTNMVLPPPQGLGQKPPKDFALLWVANAISDKKLADKITRLEAEVEVLRKKVAELSGS